ncbi:putative efflux protein [Streptomyces ambofaciens ATCC 23877]|uniref:Putative efflux protein n=1 Tax=Streptomyces ambofaciens (strain ATCC 23877 / 3486 / DSM 40053 / JCM 4204 / NBRC 12836 / NRRL B-2516) TaxID=278992 RepID=Q1RQU3_STRA7|nr:MDR family MFS transporter [Streptomyces ambofaciens]AKZ53222.1 putative efflux protein [Streptomyces ambofaciens ATCC 23877]AKZ60541.1 putative efflux protein [Streptomyces ambofaciens ATCC 23877]CAI78072.1 putative efflux protein [Streptomyces ambofaciens ATCC 23877]CAI78346.1 putative efflux protein [Streptomyces ambofaciens ATCC 23877]CAJ87851.1 putative efflux protein [Streptomyces ambofaciens ATCC 23877]
MTTFDDTSAVAAHGPAARRSSVRVLLVPLILAIMLSQLDNMIVATALPTVTAELGGLEHVSWVVTAYTLATAASTPLWGRLGDTRGRKGVLLAAITVFLIGSALSGAAQSMGQLIGFRALQGLGAGGLMAGVMATVAELVPPRERGRYQGMISAAMAIAMIGGPLAGGAVTDHLGWRWAFYLNLPLGLLALTMIWLLLRLPERRSTARLDHLGAALLMTGITAAVLLTTWGGTRYAWDSAPTLALGATAGAALWAFIRRQHRTAHPIMPPHMFRVRNFTLMSVIGFLTGFVLFGALLFLPLYQQAVQGASATNSGLLLLPMLAAMIATSLAAGRTATVSGRYKMFPVAGGALLTAGTWLLSRMDTTTSRPTAALYMAVLGAGLGFLTQIVTVVAQNSVEAHDLGAASAAITLFRTLGSCLGVAVMGTLFNREVQRVMAERAPGRPALDNAQLDAAGLARLEPALHEAYRHATAAGTHAAFVLSALAGMAVCAAALLVREVALRRTAQPTGRPARPQPDGSR